MNDLKKLLLHRNCIKSNQVRLVNGCKRMGMESTKHFTLKMKSFLLFFFFFHSVCKNINNFFLQGFFFQFDVLNRHFICYFERYFAFFFPSTRFSLCCFRFLNKTNVFCQLTFQLFCPIENWMAHIAHLMSTFPILFPVLFSRVFYLFYSFNCKRPTVVQLKNSSVKKKVPLFFSLFLYNSK